MKLTSFNISSRKLVIITLKAFQQASAFTWKECSSFIIENAKGNLGDLKKHEARNINILSAQKFNSEQISCQLLKINNFHRKSPNVYCSHYNVLMATTTGLQVFQIMPKIQSLCSLVSFAQSFIDSREFSSSFCTLLLIRFLWLLVSVHQQKSCCLKHSLNVKTENALRDV